MTAPTPARTSYWEELKIAWLNAMHVTAVLMVVAVAAVATAIRSTGSGGLLEISVAAAHPALASILLLALVPLLPGLFQSPLRVFPKNVTYPLLFGAFILMLQSLLVNSRFSLLGLDGVERYDRIWSNSLFLVAVIGAQIGVLTIGISVRRYRSPQSE